MNACAMPSMSWIKITPEMRRMLAEICFDSQNTIPAGQRLEPARQPLVERYVPEIARILAAIGNAGALVTDQSKLRDFAPEPLGYAVAEEALGIKFTSGDDRVVDVAARLRGDTGAR